MESITIKKKHNATILQENIPWEWMDHNTSGVTTQSAISKHKHLVFVPLNNKNLASIHKQKYLCESLGIQYHVPRGPGKVFPTCALRNRRKGSSTGCDTYRRLWIGSSPSWLQSSSTYSPLTWAVAYGSESLCGSAGFQRRSVNAFLWVRWRLDFASITAPLRQHHLGLKDLISQRESQQGDAQLILPHSIQILN